MRLLPNTLYLPKTYYRTPFLFYQPWAKEQQRIKGRFFSTSVNWSLCLYFNCGQHARSKTRDRGDLFGLLNYWTLYTKVQQPTLIELSNLALRSIIIAQTRTNIRSIHTHTNGDYCTLRWFRLKQRLLQNSAKHANNRGRDGKSSIL